MTYWQFSLNCRASELETTEDLLLGLGALSLSIGDAGDEPLYEPLPGETPLWRESVLTATFDAESDPEILWQQISGALPAELAAGLRRHALEERDWEQAYRDHFQPIECAPGLWIVPSWAEPPAADATVIELDPGLAFGTGSHPTTALCLAWLAANPPRGKQVIDYGCGSGILAIAALKLGARDVIAVDIDPQALEATRNNLEVNGIDPNRVQVLDPAAMGASAADLLIANILAGPLIELAPRFAAMLGPGGKILLSGILISQLEDIQSAYRAEFELDPPATRGDWASISATRN